jgi:succinate dehydrogenase / fumarate reductase, flavoprotein subunit
MLLAITRLEFWQFHAAGIAGTGLLLTECYRGESGYLFNSEGKRYMERYFLHLKGLTCPDTVSRATCAL